MGIYINRFGAYLSGFKGQNCTDDRIRKIDSHLNWALFLLFSGKQASENKILVLSAIGWYYTIFHLSFSLAALDLDNLDGKLRKVSHQRLRKMLDSAYSKQVITRKYLEVFDDLKDVREHVNYLSVGSGSGCEKVRHIGENFKFKSRTHGDFSYSSFIIQIEHDLKQVIDEFRATLSEFEAALCKSGVKIAFPTLHRSVHDEVYGGDNFLFAYDHLGQVTKEVRAYLFDITPKPSTSK